MGRPWHPMFHFQNPRRTPFVPIRWSGALPHLYKPGGLYFVSFRLWDAIMRDEQLAALKRAAYRAAARGQQRDRDVVRKLLDAAATPLQLGSCVLAQPELAKIVQDTLLRNDVWHVLKDLPKKEQLSISRLPPEVHYLLTSWSIMPNHVHVTYIPAHGHQPSDIQQAWKSITAHKINERLNRKGDLWLRESFDHLVRSEEHHEVFIEYNDDNARKAGLCLRGEDWPFCSAHPSHRV